MEYAFYYLYSRDTYQDTFYLNDYPIVIDALPYTILQYCELNFLTIPRFCYHDTLSVSGNCRICVVEILDSLKLVVSCCTEVVDGMFVYTETNIIDVIREQILEFLLVNHPLDCPICDQGGECDLQDLALVYGSDISKYKSYKRGSIDFDTGPFIKTVLTRCIHCTRCLRYASEISSNSILGMLGRGGASTIGTFVDTLFESEISGNVIDICPVGALTSKVYAFQYRAWELRSVDSLDILDSLCSTIRIDTRGNMVTRILPKINSTLNYSWISDKIRFAFDGFFTQKMTRPFVRTKTYDFVISSWEFCLNYVHFNLNTFYTIFQNSSIIVWSGIYTDLETSSIIKTLTTISGTHLYYNLIQLDAKFRAAYTLNKNVSTLESSTFFFFFGLDTRRECPILNVLISRNSRDVGSVSYYYIGSPIGKSDMLLQCGTSSNTFLSFLYGQIFICYAYSLSKDPIFIFGVGAGHSLCRYLSYIDLFSRYTRSIPIYGFLSPSTGYLSNMEIASTWDIRAELQDSTDSVPCFNYYIGSINANFKIPNMYMNSFFSVYQGDIPDTRLSAIDVLLPSATYFDTSTFFVNLEGRTQRVSKRLNSGIPSNCDVLKVLFVKLFWSFISNITTLLAWSQIELRFPYIFRLNTVFNSSFRRNLRLYTTRVFFDYCVYVHLVRKYYFTDPVSSLSTNTSKFNRLYSNTVALNFF